MFMSLDDLNTRVQQAVAATDRASEAWAALQYLCREFGHAAWWDGAGLWADDTGAVVLAVTTPAVTPDILAALPPTVGNYAVRVFRSDDPALASPLASSQLGARSESRAGTLSARTPRNMLGISDAAAGVVAGGAIVGIGLFVLLTSPIGIGAAIGAAASEKGHRGKGALLGAAAGLGASVLLGVLTAHTPPAPPPTQV